MSIDIIARGLAGRALLQNVNAASTPYARGASASAGTVGYKLQELVSVHDFGAAGNGITDDTAAIQGAINACLTTAGGHLYFPAGTYKISAALVIPFSANWRIWGASRGNTSIVQSVSNTQIFTFNSDETWGFAIEELTLTWAAEQGSTNTGSVAIYFNDSHASPGGFWDIHIRRCNFNNGFRAIANNPALGAPIWGIHISNCTFQGGMTGASVYFSPSPQVGQPRICIENCELDANNATEPLIQITAADTVELRSLEMLNGTAPVALMLVSTCLNVTVVNCRSENYNFAAATSGPSLWVASQSNVVWIGCTITGFLGTTSNPVLLRGTNGARFTILGLTIESSLTTGYATAYNCDEITLVDKVTMIGNATDQQITYTGSKSTVRVNAAASLFDRVDTNGTSSVTLTNTSGKFQLFNQTLLTNINCTLPSTGMYVGMAITVIRRATTPGAFALQVVDPLSGQNYTFAASTNGSVRYKYVGNSYVILEVAG